MVQRRTQQEHTFSISVAAVIVVFSIVVVPILPLVAECSSTPTPIYICEQSLVTINTTSSGHIYSHYGFGDSPRPSDVDCSSTFNFAADHKLWFRVASLSLEAGDDFLLMPDGQTVSSAIGRVFSIEAGEALVFLTNHESQRGGFDLEYQLCSGTSAPEEWNVTNSSSSLFASSSSPLPTDQPAPADSGNSDGFGVLVLCGKHTSRSATQGVIFSHACFGESDCHRNINCTTTFGNHGLDYAFHIDQFDIGIFDTLVINEVAYTNNGTGTVNLTQIAGPVTIHFRTNANDTRAGFRILYQTTKGAAPSWEAIAKRADKEEGRFCKNMLVYIAFGVVGSSWAVAGAFQKDPVKNTQQLSEDDPKDPIKPIANAQAFTFETEEALQESSTTAISSSLPEEELEEDVPEVLIFGYIACAYSLQWQQSASRPELNNFSCANHSPHVRTCDGSCDASCQVCFWVVE